MEVNKYSIDEIVGQMYKFYEKYRQHPNTVIVDKHLFLDSIKSKDLAYSSRDNYYSVVGLKVVEVIGLEKPIVCLVGEESKDEPR